MWIYVVNVTVVHTNITHCLAQMETGDPNGDPKGGYTNISQI